MKREVYFRLNDTAGIAYNRKVGSSAIARGIADTLKPAKLQRIAYPKGHPGITQWQEILPTIKDPALVYLAVRDAVERFISSCAEVRRMDVDTVLGELETSGFERADAHFWPQAPLATATTKLYRFPEQLDDLAADAGLNVPLPVVNEEIQGDRPTLTAAQAARVRAIYAADVALFESIAKAEQELIVPKTIELGAVPVLTARQLRLWLIGAGLTIAQIDAQIDGIKDEKARESARVEWEYSTAYHHDHPLVVQIGTALGLSQPEIDAAFRAAAHL